MITYFETLERAAADLGADLKQAFTAAGLPTSTFYRAKNGTDLHYDTAVRVWERLVETELPERVHPTGNSKAALNASNAA